METTRVSRLATLSMQQSRVFWCVVRFATTSSSQAKSASVRKGRPFDRKDDPSMNLGSGKTVEVLAAKHGAVFKRPTLTRGNANAEKAAAPSVAVGATSNNRPRPPPPRPQPQPPDEAAKLAEAVLARGHVAELLSFFMNRRMSFDHVTAPLLLARIAAVRSKTGTDDLLIRTEEAFTALLADTLQHVKLVAGPAGTMDPRVLSSVVHALGKLRDVVPPPSTSQGAGAGQAGKNTSQAFKTLAHTALELVEPGMHRLPPKSLAMVSWGAYKLGVRDRTFFDNVWSAVTTGTASKAPSWRPPAAPEAAQTKLKAGQKDIVVGGGCPFEPRDLSMFASSLAHPGCMGWNQPGAVGGAPSPWEGMANWVLDASPFLPHAALESVILAYSSAVQAGDEGLIAAKRKFSPDTSPAANTLLTSMRNATERRRLVLFALSEELSVRLGVAQEMALSGTHGRAALPEELRASAVLSEGTLLSDQRLAVLEPEIALEATRALLHAGITPTGVLSALVRWFIAKGPVKRPALDEEGLPEEGGSAGAGENGTGGGSGPAERGEPLVTRLSTRGLSTLSFVLAKAPYDDASTPYLWYNIRQRASALLGAGSGTGREVLEYVSKQPGARPLYHSSIAWGLSRCGVPAAPYVQSVLSMAAARPPAFSVPSLCQLLWSGAIHKCLTPALVSPILEHILDVAGEKAAAYRSGQAQLSLYSDPDAGTSQLLQLRPTIPGTSRMQGQLRTALLSLHIEGRQGGWADKEVDTVLAMVPPAALSAWSASLTFIEPRVSRAHADVHRVLTAVGLPYTPEYITPEGLFIDTLIKPADWSAALRSNSSPDSSSSLLAQYPLGIAIEVDGPLHYTRAVPGFNTGKGHSRGGPLPGVQVAPPPAALPRAIAGGSTGLEPSIRDLEEAVRVKSEARVAGKDKARQVTGLDDEAASTVEPLPGVSFEQLSSLGHALTPTLSTQAKAAWLSGLGYKVVSLSFSDWESALSTQEKAELLAEKGVPVHRKHLSY